MERAPVVSGHLVGAPGGSGEHLPLWSLGKARLSLVAQFRDHLPRRQLPRVDVPPQFLGICVNCSLASPVVEPRVGVFDLLTTL